MADVNKEPLPIACNMGVFTPEERDNHIAVFRELHAAILDTEDLPDGRRFNLRPDGEVLKTLAGFIDGERRCCPFFTFTVRLSPESAALSLDLTGPEGTRAFIDEEFAALP